MTRFSSSARALVATVAVAVLALTATGCKGNVAAAAAVNGHDISAENLVEGARYFGVLSGTSTTKLTTSTVPTEVVSGYLSFLIEGELIHRIARAEGISVSQTDLDAAATLAKRQLTSNGAKVKWESFPAWLRNDLSRTQAEYQAIAKKRAAGSDNTAQARKVYDDNKLSFTAFCIDALATPTQAAAAGAVTRLRAGTSFATVAQDLKKNDPKVSVGGKGDGNMGCLTASQLQQQQFDPATLQNLAASADGDVLGPVSYAGEYLVLHLRSRTLQSFESVKAQILASLPPPGQAAASSALQAAMDRARVSVNPRYGEWKRQSGTFRVVAPTGADAPATGATVAAPVGGSASTSN